MKNLSKKILSGMLAAILLSGYVVAEVYNVDESTKGKMVTPLFNLIKTTQWDLFLSEFEITLKPGFCGDDLLDGKGSKAIGLKARMIEPIGYMETTMERMHFPFADFTISESTSRTSVDRFDGGAPDTGYGGIMDKIMKWGTSREVVTEEGESTAREYVMWSHFIYVPVFHLLFKKRLKFICFSGGDIAIPFLSEFFPPYTKDLIYKNLIGQMLIMFSPQGLISQIINCAASSAVNTMHEFYSGENGELTASKMDAFVDEYAQYDPNQQDGAQKKAPDESFRQKTEYYLDSIRNTMYWDAGCLGFAPVGGYVPAEDPGADHELIAYGLLNLLHGASALLPKPFLFKQTNFSLAGAPETSDGRSLAALDSMCEPKKYPMVIESQYVFQRAGVPSIGRGHVLAATPIVSTTTANGPESKDDWVSMVWQFRDFRIFAYHCPE